MATEAEKTFCVVDIHSTKSVVTLQREFETKVEKDPPTANSIRKCIQNFWTQVAYVRGRVHSDRVCSEALAAKSKEIDMPGELRVVWLLLSYQ
jgi:hypothetical protein